MEYSWEVWLNEYVTQSDRYNEAWDCAFPFGKILKLVLTGI
jgi:hypothetical protein